MYLYLGSHSWNTVLLLSCCSGLCPRSRWCVRSLGKMSPIHEGTSDIRQICTCFYWGMYVLIDRYDKVRICMVIDEVLEKFDDIALDCKDFQPDEIHMCAWKWNSWCAWKVCSFFNLGQCRVDLTFSCVDITTQDNLFLCVPNFGNVSHVVPGYT